MSRGKLLHGSKEGLLPLHESVKDFPGKEKKQGLGGGCLLIPSLCVETNALEVVCLLGPPSGCRQDAVSKWCAEGSVSEGKKFIQGQGVEGKLLECWKQCNIPVVEFFV